MVSLEDNLLLTSSGWRRSAHFIYTAPIVKEFLFVQMFFTQFYFYPALGALVIVLLCLIPICFFKIFAKNWCWGGLLVIGFLYTFPAHNILWLLYGNTLLVFVGAILFALKKKFGLCDRFKSKINRQLKYIPVALLIVFSASSVIFYNNRVFDIYKTEYFFKNREWKKIVDNINAEEFDNETQSITKSSYEKTALLCSGQALEKIFTLPRPAFPSLFPTEIRKDEAQIISAVELYTEAGMYGAALHLLFDLITAGNINSYTISRIVEVSELCGDTAPAEKFKKILRASLFGNAKISKLHRLAKPKSCMQETTNHVINAYGIKQTMIQEYAYITRDTNDKKQVCVPVLEYVLVEMLFGKGFTKEDLLVSVEDIRAAGYKKLPQSLQEALLIAGFDPAESASGYRIDIKTVQERDIFLQNLEKVEQDKMSIDRLAAFYGKNYFFYYKYESVKEDDPLQQNSSI
jgi:branched-subunit amino acid transport protein